MVDGKHSGGGSSVLLKMDHQTLRFWMIVAVLGCNNVRVVWLCSIWDHHLLVLLGMLLGSQSFYAFLGSSQTAQSCNIKIGTFPTITRLPGVYNLITSDTTFGKMCCSMSKK